MPATRRAGRNIHTSPATDAGLRHRLFAATMSRLGPGALLVAAVSLLRVQPVRAVADASAVLSPRANPALDICFRWAQQCRFHGSTFTLAYMYVIHGC